VLELSWYGSRSVPASARRGLPLAPPHAQEQPGGPDPAGSGAALDHARRMGTALGLLRDERLDALISGESDFEDLPRRAGALSRDPGNGALCHRIRYATRDRTSEPEPCTA
jgi:hypothetical protein